MLCWQPSGTTLIRSGVFFSSVLKHPSLSLKYGRSSPKSLPMLGYVSISSLGRGQAGPRNAAASDAAAGASARSREELVEARYCNRHRDLEKTTGVTTRVTGAVSA